MSTNDSQGYWERFAAARSTLDEAQTAALALHGSLPAYDAYRDRAERIAVGRLLPRLAAGGRVLDLGCGPGRWTVPLAQEADQVVAVDFSARMIEHARARATAAGVQGRITFLCSALQSLDEQTLLPPFDLVFAFGILQHLPEEDLRHFLPLLARVVKPGGLLLHRETRARRAFSRTTLSPDGAAGLTSHYRTFETHCRAFENLGFRLLDRRSILPPNLLYVAYARFFRPGQGGLPLRAILGLHERVIDPLWRAFPRLLWAVNSRRASDQCAALYRKVGP